MQETAGMRLCRFPSQQKEENKKKKRSMSSKGKWDNDTAITSKSLLEMEE